MINLKNICLTFKGKKILHNISLTIAPGTIHSFIGPSGAGKTSLLKSIVGLYPDYEGTIQYETELIKAMTPQKRAMTIGFVFQQFNLFPHMTVLENCTHPMINTLSQPGNLAEQKAIEMLAQVGMQDYKNRYPTSLSGGQQQRAAIARALCLNPKVLLLDEPTSALDPESSNQLISLIKQINDLGITIIISSHDMNFIKSLNCHIHFIKNGALIESQHISQMANHFSENITLFLNHNNTQDGYEK